MTDMSDGRMPAAQEAMKKTPEELVTWAVERTHDDSLRQSIVQLDFAQGLCRSGQGCRGGE